MQNWFVVVMGMGTVFIVLILLIALCYLLGLLCRGSAKKEAEKLTEPAEPTQDRAELAAAISAAIAEYSGSDMSAIRILSMKKL